jgi:hypothetical protein
MIALVGSAIACHPEAYIRFGSVAEASFLPSSSALTLKAEISRVYLVSLPHVDALFISSAEFLQQSKRRFPANRPRRLPIRLLE